MSERGFAVMCVLMLATMIGASVGIVLWSDPLAEQPLRLLVVGCGSQRQQRAMAEGAQTAAKECGAELTFREVLNVRPGSLVESIAGVVAEGIRGAIVADALSVDLVRAVRKCSGVSNVVTCGSAALGEDPLVHVGANPHAAGRACANLVREAVPAGGRILVIVNGSTDAWSRDCFVGFQEALETGMKVAVRWKVVKQVADGDPVFKRFNHGRPVPLHTGGIDCIVDLRSRHHDGDTQGFAKIARGKGVKLITFDSSDAAIAAVEMGDVYAVVTADSYMQGYQAVQHLVSICRGSEFRRPAPGLGQVNVPVSIVRRGNVAEYRANYFAAL